MMVTKQEIEQLAILAKLSFSEEEIEELTHDMDEIINFANQVNSFPYDKEETLDNRVKLADLREDEVKESFGSEVVTSNVASENGFFPVKRSNNK
ncbi:MAG: Asp-tRNA(Asn)/Glu-tRNA(Gln) amidotransferase subunit GatC [Clostridia bacterium]|nr:Asp-tRNA(Asn)/Glu-tRNA(Gln) amidotransferase subunit GatC [Clostridia bacterium]